MTNPVLDGDELPIPDLPRRGEVGFTIDGERFVFPDLPASAWLDALIYEMPAAWQLLIPQHLTLGEQRRLTRKLTDRRDPFDIDHLEKSALTVLGAVCGVEFHVAQRLIAGVRGDWMLFDGWCAQHGIDPLELHVSRLCGIAYYMRLSACEKESERFAERAKLWAPPEGKRASGRSWLDDPDVHVKLDRIESDAFMGMFG